MEIKEFIAYLKTQKRIFIQAHNNPDHDAIASAFALQQLLKAFKIKARIFFDGTLVREQLKNFLEELKIDIVHLSKYRLKASDQVIIVDGCKGNSNVTKVKGTIAGIIDHHEGSYNGREKFLDLRPEVGANVSTIIDYYKQLGVEISRNVATAAVLGINVDTQYLTRGVHELDLESYFNCYKLSDKHFAAYNLRNKIALKDLDTYKYLIDNLRIFKNIGFCYLPLGCTQNLLGIMADFLLSLDEINFAMVCALNNDNINLSARSEIKDLGAAVIVKKLLFRNGFGGGHADQAGGIITRTMGFKEESFFSKLIDVINEVSKETHDKF